MTSKIDQTRLGCRYAAAGLAFHCYFSAWRVYSAVGDQAEMIMRLSSEAAWCATALGFPFSSLALLRGCSSTFVLWPGLLLAADECVFITPLRGSDRHQYCQLCPPRVLCGILVDDLFAHRLNVRWLRRRPFIRCVELYGVYRFVLVLLAVSKRDSSV